MVKDVARTILFNLNKNMYEREDAINFAFLSSVAGESIFLLGPPGVAKSMIARRLKYAYRGAIAFEYLMSRYSTPDEIFGPVSIKQLKDNDCYTRVTESYLPGANIVFLDEIWKAGPAIQNALLTVINEKIYRNGAEEMRVDLRALVSASNELPEEGQGLEALWDRFIVRLYVGGIEDRGKFDQMIINTEDDFQDVVPDELKISDEDYISWSTGIDEVIVDRNILDLIDHIRRRIAVRNEELPEGGRPIIVSDRRWKRIVRILRTSAFLNGRREVDLMDCFIIPFCVWNEREQIDEMRGLVEELVRDQGYVLDIDVEGIRTEKNTLKEEVKEHTAQVVKVDRKVPLLQNGDYYKFEEYPNDIMDEMLDEAPYSFGRSRSDEFFISKQDFSKLGRKNFTEISVQIKINDYSGDTFRTIGRMLVKRGDECELSIKGDTDVITASVVGKADVKSIEKLKPPHRALKKEWDKHVERLFGLCDKSIAKIEVFKLNKESDLVNHLFFGPEYGRVITTNLDNTIKTITGLKQEIEKTRYYYENIKGD